MGIQSALTGATSQIIGSVATAQLRKEASARVAMQKAQAEEKAKAEENKAQALKQAETTKKALKTSNRDILNKEREKQNTGFSNEEYDKMLTSLGVQDAGQSLTASPVDVMKARMANKRAMDIRVAKVRQKMMMQKGFRELDPDYVYGKDEGGNE